MMRPVLAMLVVAIGVSSASAGTSLDALVREGQRARAERSAAVERQRAEQGVKLGEWSCVGPFRDEEFGDIERSFATVFAPEKDVLAAGKAAPDLLAVYEAKRLPGMTETRRPWSAHPEWTDGYRHLLPRGPAPSRNETLYLYRTIHSRAAASLEMRLFAEDYLGAWLNGKKLGEARREYGPNHYPVPLVVKLPLEEGENRLLVKITSMYAAHGFAFSLPPFTPGSTLLPLQWSAEIRRDNGSNFSEIDRPYASAEEFAESAALGDMEGCVRRAAGALEIPEARAREILAAAPDEAAAAARQAHRLGLALRRLERFRFDVTMTPMFDPPQSQMDRIVHQENAPTAGGQAYLDALRPVKARAADALARYEKGDLGAATAVLEAADALEAMWRQRIRQLPPIVFLRCPAFDVNAIAPISSGGAAPASLCVFDPARPQEAPRVIWHEPGATIFDFNLSYDARTIFFAARRKGVAGGWHIYEVGVDGSGLKQITSGNCNDISPLLLPSGQLMFVSDRATTWVQCQVQKAGLLYTCARDGAGVRKVSANIDSDHAPQIMNDGRVMFTRWDYGIEKNVFARHALWSMNPDGTGLRLFFGNTIEDPAGFWEARQVPGRPEVVCAFGPHHSFHAGMAGILWNGLGPEAPRGAGFRFLTDEVPVYCDTTFPNGYQDLFPVNEREFLVSYGGDGAGKNRLYLLDDRGNRKCIYEAEGKLGCWNPILLAPRVTPPVIPTQCENPEWVYRDPEEMNASGGDPTTGSVLVQNVYAGLEPAVKPGEAKYIAVLEQVQKSRCMAGGEGWGHTPIMGRGTVHARRMIGLVPIEADGSAHFTVPALRSISFNVLSAEGKLLMRMGSDTHVMPGERQSCVGCHENRTHGVTPATAARTPLAARHEPVTPRQPDWGTQGLLDYQKVVQPVLDRYCIKCHSGSRVEGLVDLSGDRTRFFCMSYENLVERDLVEWHQPFARDHDETAPLTVGSIVSRICRYIDDDKHCGEKMSFDDRLRIYTWIDANVPYYGTYRYNKMRGIGARDSWEADAGAKGWIQAGVWKTFERRCMSCHRREVHNQGLWGFGGGTMGRTMTVSSRIWTDRGLTAHMFPERNALGALLGPELRINLTHPQYSLLLQAPLAKEAGGLGLCRDEGGASIFKNRDDSDYRLMLLSIEAGKAALYASPRVDMDEQHVAEVRKTVLSDEALRAVREQMEAEEIKAHPMALSAGLAVLKDVPPACANLARDAKASSDDGVPIQGGPPRVSEQAAIDGDPETIWDDIDGKKLYKLKVTFPVARRISAISMTAWAQHDFAARDFSILCDGKEVGRVQNARYQDNRLILRLPPQRCQSLELSITGYYGGSPCIRELEIYDLP